MSKLVLLSGPARVGKTTMLNHIRAVFPNQVCFPDSGNALKVYWTAHKLRLAHNQTINMDLGDLYLETKSRTELLRYMKLCANDLLGTYEILKKQATEAGKAQEFRNELIGFAESVRAVDPTFWVRAGIRLWGDSSKIALSTALNQEEYDLYLPHYDDVTLIALDCLNPKAKEEDTRGRVCLRVEDFSTKQSWINMTYKLEESKTRIEKIFRTQFIKEQY